jgi:signal transduction histidine kinase/ActR/RegA family two-component response regulator
MWMHLGTGSYSIRLFVATAVIALATALLLTFQLIQRQALVEQSQLRVDSQAAPAFLLDREFLRFQHALELYLYKTTPVPKDDVLLRLDMLASKVDIVRESPGMAFIFKDPDNIESVEKIDEFVQRAQQALNTSDSGSKELRQLSQDMAAFTAQAHSLGTSADLMASIVMEQQYADLLTQNQQITWLTLVLLVFLMATAIGLLSRHRSQQKENAALTTLNEQLRQAQQDAEAASRGKSLFLANMSHELRTPFNGIMGILSVLASTPLSPPQADLIHTVNNSAEHFLKLLNDILDSSALESGKISIQAEAVDLRTLMMDVHAIMLPLALQKNLNFTLLDIPAQAFWVKSDGTRLRQILLNLLNNAIKFTEKGQVGLQFQQSSDATGQQFFEFAVIDTGIGIHEASLSKLFQRFYQVDSGLSRQSSGAGLGLEISLGLARLLRGDILVESQPDQGSTFRVRLPLVPHTPAVPAVISPPTEDATTQAKHVSLRILVAEDHPVNQKFLEVLLQRMGHTATFCDNGALALQALQEQDYDVVLMDIHMPVMDGLTATSHIRALPSEKSNIPVIVLSADVYSEARDKAAVVGVNAFIPKPVQAQELQTTLHLHVVSKRAQVDSLSE